MKLLPEMEEVVRFRTLIIDLLGLHFDESKFGHLAKVLHNRLLANGLESTPYLDRLSASRSGEEIGILARELTVTETYFLRNFDQFKAFIEVALTNRATAHGTRQIQILSAGCASGDEPYSLAIAVREYFPLLADRIAITGLDVNPSMLQKASRARYTNWSLRECPDGLKTRWFRREGDAFILDEAIRRTVKFEPRNLACGAPDFWLPARFDIVFCRNVLMYFGIEQAQAAMRRIAHAMTPGGYLFLGHAETMRGLSNDFHLCHTHGAFYYQRKELDALPETVFIPPLARWRPETLPGDTSWIEAIQRASERIHALVPAMEKARIGDHDSTPMHAVPDLHRTLEHLHNERFDQALEHIADLPVEHAHDSDVLLLKAVSLSHSGSLAAAESICRDLLARDELSAGAHYVMALCRESSGDIEGALEHDQTAAYLDPAFAMPRLHLGLLTRRHGEREAARRDLSEALALLHQEEPSRVLLFGGGFKREALIALCRAELAALGENT